MLVNEWVETVWVVLNVRDKTLKDYKHLYKHKLKSSVGSIESNQVQLWKFKDFHMRIQGQNLASF